MIADANNFGSVLIEFLFFAVLVVGAIVAALYQNRIRQSRSSDLEMLATRLSFDEFNAHRDEGFAMGWGFLSLLGQGSNRYAFNILRGKYHEQTLLVFDYHYQTGSGKSTQNHDLTMLMLVLKVVFPRVTIGPQSLGERIAAAFGIGEDIKFESAEFSRTFCVRATDKKFAYDVCNPQMIEYLLANQALHIEINGPVILLAFEPQLPVDQIEYNLQRLAEIRELLPAYLFTQNV